MNIHEDKIRLPSLPSNKNDLKMYFVHLTFTLERELVEIPDNIKELKYECREMQKHLVRCNVKVPVFDKRMRDFV